MRLPLESLLLLLLLNIVLLLLLLLFLGIVQPVRRGRESVSSVNVESPVDGERVRGGGGRHLGLRLRL